MLMDKYKLEHFVSVANMLNDTKTLKRLLDNGM